MSATLDTTPLFEELDYREGNGLEVWLLWSRETNQVSVAVYDERAGEIYELSVDPGAALDAFRHPYAYAQLPARDLAEATSTSI